jgi:radical SAM superfamily enzyme YgiQ (UPF0313 family)
MKKGNRFFLLYPPISKTERYSSKLGSAGGEQIPLGIYYLGSYLRENGYEVRVVDGEAENLTTENVLEMIKEFSPGFVGISSTTVAFHRSTEMADEIKKNFSDIKIVLGGAHVSSNTEHAMSFGNFDYGVTGEGELTLLELLDALNNGNDLTDIKGIVYRDNNKLVINPPREYIKDLDILPFPAYDLIKNIKLYTPPPTNYKRLPVVNVITSRGCPSGCTFCDKNVFGDRYRVRSAENIFQEIKYLHEKYNLKEIAFVDDTFLINKKRIYKLFELLNNAGISFYWTCLGRINDVNYDYLKFLKSNGCWHISFGIESGDEEILKRIKKNISLEKVRRVTNWCKELKIKTKGFFIIGHPGETAESIEKTISFGCSLKIDDAVITINTPIPGSPQYAEVDKYGTLDETDWSQFNCWRPVFVPYGLTEEILVKKHKEFYRKFYFRPKQLLRYFLSFFSTGGFKRFKSVLIASLYLLQRGKSKA